MVSRTKVSAVVTSSAVTSSVVTSSVTARTPVTSSGHVGRVAGRLLRPCCLSGDQRSCVFYTLGLRLSVSSPDEGRREDKLLALADSLPIDTVRMYIEGKVFLHLFCFLYLGNVHDIYLLHTLRSSFATFRFAAIISAVTAANKAKGTVKTFVLNISVLCPLRILFYFLKESFKK